MRDNVLVKIAPIRITMYRVGDDGQIYNRFRLTVANRQSREARVEFSLIGLANASLISLPSLLQLQPNQTIQQEFEIAVPTGSLSPGVNHFEITTRVIPNNEQQTFKETFITPSKRP